MTGTDIIGALLLADPGVTAIVPAGQIKAGMLPEGVKLPCLLVRTVSSVDEQMLKRGSSVRVTDRVSVAVRAISLRQARQVIAAVRAACAGHIGGGHAVSILTAGLGPDLIGPGNSFEQTQDFRVGFNADT